MSKYVIQKIKALLLIMLLALPMYANAGWRDVIHININIGIPYLVSPDGSFWFWTLHKKGKKGYWRKES